MPAAGRTYLRERPQSCEHPKAYMLVPYDLDPGTLMKHKDKRRIDYRNRCSLPRDKLTSGPDQIPTHEQIYCKQPRAIRAGQPDFLDG